MACGQKGKRKSPIGRLSEVSWEIVSISTASCLTQVLVWSGVQ